MISTLMQPIINQNDLFVDNNEQPLVYGRLDFLDPVSNNPINVYSYADDEFTILTNPIRLDIEGRSEQTVFSDRLTYCRLYAYKGLDEHNQPIYVFVREWYAGHEAQSEISDTVYGIEALRDLNPEFNKNVMVIGYHNEHDCGPRNYYWDENSTLDVDNIYIIGSDHSSTGRWILNFDGEYLPSTFAGVYPGKVANINALMSYVEVINGRKTAPGIWFVPGEYAVDTNLNTAKRVLLDANTMFDCQYFYCGNLTVKGEPQNAICDFDFRDPEQEAHSSWFRTMAGYLTCNAKKFIFDERDNFLNHTLQNTSYTLQNKIIEGQTRLPVTYNGDNCRIVLNNCAINAERIFNDTDRLSFSYTDINDNWWTNPASVDWNTNVRARSVALNRIQLGNFTNVNAYVNAKVADGATFVDLAGREIGSLTFNGSLIELRNAYVTNSLTISKPGVDVYLKHVVCGNVYCSCRYIHVEDNSNITFSSEPSFSAMWADDSEIHGSSFWTSHNKQIVCTRCQVAFGLNWAQDNDFDHPYIEFTDCTFQENNSYYVKRIVMKRCVTNNNTIRVYPHKVDSVYYIGQVTLESNTFNNTNPVEFTKVDVIDGWAQDNCYECIAQWNITNNLFLGNSEGLRARYWQHRTGSNYNKTFIAGSGNTITYTGNIGNCPDENSKGMTISGNQTYTTKTVIVGESTFTLYKYSSAYKRVMPIIVYDWAQGYFFRSIAGNDTLIKYYSWINTPYDSLTYDLFIQPTWYLYHIEEDNPTSNGDFFRMGITTFNDYLRIVQRGDGDHNKGIIGKVI